MRSFKEITMREKLSSRGGGVEIDLTSLGFKNHKMSAYQNYLGGGILGSIQSNDTIRSQFSNVRLQLEFSNRFNELDEIAEDLKLYFGERMGFDQNEMDELQRRPRNAY
jgi:hypothetical protein